MKPTLVVVVLLTGCFATRSTSTVSDSDVGRLQSGQLGPISQAQEAAAAAEQDRSRRAHETEVAQQRLEATVPEERVASAHVDEAAALVKAADSSGDPGQIDQAGSRLSAAYAELQRSRAEIAYRRAVVEARQKAGDDAEAEVRVRDARLQQARLTALQDAGNPSANKYQESIFASQVAQRSADEANTKAAMVTAEKAAAEARGRWQQLGGGERSGLSTPTAAAPSGSPTPNP